MNAKQKLNEVYQQERAKVRAGKETNVGALETCLKHIRAAGCEPNRRFYAAWRAAKALDAICAQPMPEIPSKTYVLVGSNGVETKIEVPDSITELGKRINFIHQAAKDRHIELASFHKEVA